MKLQRGRSGVAVRAPARHEPSDPSTRGSPISRRCIRRRSRWASSACAPSTRGSRSCQRARSSPSPAPTARARPARCSNACSPPAGIAPASTPRRTSCATTSACASRAPTPTTPRCAPPSPRWRPRARTTPLTYFEFGTLAALWLFARARLDALVLEVGLGGRLDAVNIVDADVAIVTSIAIDHMDYLGPTREDIGARESRHLPRRAGRGLRRPRSAGRAHRARAAHRRAAAAARRRLRLCRAGQSMALLRARRSPARPALSGAARRLPARQRGDRADRARRAARAPCPWPRARCARRWSASSCRAASRCCRDAR